MITGLFCSETIHEIKGCAFGSAMNRHSEHSNLLDILKIDFDIFFKHYLNCLLVLMFNLVYETRNGLSTKIAISLVDGLCCHMQNVKLKFTVTMFRDRNTFLSVYGWSDLSYRSLAV